MKGQYGDPRYPDQGMGDWQYEIEMEQNVRYIADMQSQLSRQLA